MGCEVVSVVFFLVFARFYTVFSFFDVVGAWYMRTCVCVCFFYRVLLYPRNNDALFLG